MIKYAAIFALLFCMSIPAMADKPADTDKETPSAQSITTPDCQKDQPAEAIDQSDAPTGDDDDSAEIIVNLGDTEKDKTNTEDSQPAAKETKSSSKPKAMNKAQMERLTQLSREALSHRGTPYIWGGTGRVGYDCSGFTQAMLAKKGVKLPHSAKEQYKLGTAVPKSDLKEGDLVFFNTRGPITHVGIYIGHGYFVHAANPRRGVTLDELDSAYYTKRYAGGRRYLSDNS